MTWEAFWQMVSVVCVWVAAPFFTANVILYACVHNWRSSPEGKALMRTFVLLMLLTGFTVAFDVVPSFPGKNVIAAAVLLYMLYGAVRFTYLLSRELVRQRRHDRARP